MWGRTVVRPFAFRDNLGRSAQFSGPRARQGRYTLGAN